MKQPTKQLTYLKGTRLVRFRCVIMVIATFDRLLINFKKPSYATISECSMCGKRDIATFLKHIRAKLHNRLGEAQDQLHEVRNQLGKARNQLDEVLNQLDEVQNQPSVPLGSVVAINNEPS